MLAFASAGLLGCATKGSGAVGTTLAERRGLTVTRVRLERAVEVANSSEPGRGGVPVAARLVGEQERWRFEVLVLRGDRVVPILVQTGSPLVCAWADDPRAVPADRVAVFERAAADVRVPLVNAVRIAQSEVKGGRAVDVRLRQLAGAGAGASAGAGGAWDVICVVGERLKWAVVDAGDGRVLEVRDEPESNWKKDALTWVRTGGAEYEETGEVARGVWPGAGASRSFGHD